MNYEAELQFLCDTFIRCHVRANTATQEEIAKIIEATDPRPLFGSILSHTWALQELRSPLQPNTVYHLSDDLELCYTYLLISETEPVKLLLIGPYLSIPMSEIRIPEICERRGISPNQQRYLKEYYASIPVLPSDCHLFTMLNLFCERIWNNPTFAIVDVNRRHPVPASLINRSMREDHFEDILVSMETMEQRYAFENDLMHAVSRGQLHIETQFLSAFSDSMFEKRTADPLRNAKNYCIIMNTLLRKAAERGGVHPIYLDNVSAEFAKKIEQLPSLERTPKLMREMFRSYCRLVRKHTMTQYSPPVQKTILLIDSDISADLSLKTLANAQSISAGYLSTIFKKETGKTVSEYIRERRIAHAAHLLESTNLQIQTVALHCGIIDVQYFSKLFKRQMGKTPSEYRFDLRQTQQ